MEHAVVHYSWAVVDGVMTKANRIVIPEQSFLKAYHC